jgi:hypothetical protein
MAGLEDLGITRDEIEAVMRSDEVLQAKIELAELAAEYWRSIAPVRTGKYRDSIHVEVHGDDVSVRAADDAASYIEYGTSDTAEFACRAQTSAKFADRED